MSARSAVRALRSPEPGEPAPAAAGSGRGKRAVDLGRRVRALRTGARLTLKDIAQRSGLSVSTLSKIENNQLSPTYENIIRLARGLAVDIAVLFSEQPLKVPVGRRSITRKGDGRVFVTPNYDYEMLCADVVGKKIIPLKVRIKARSRHDFSQLITHEGEEVIFVLSGRIELATEYYEPMQLGPGDCVYFDSTMGHVCFALGLADAEVFWVCSSIDAVHLVEREGARRER